MKRRQGHVKSRDEGHVLRRMTDAPVGPTRKDMEMKTEIQVELRL